jgi:hypothetical protein
MATDAQGRELSPDGNYYWDGSNWQLVAAGGAASGGAASGSAGSTSSQSQGGGTDAQGRQLSADGNYYWDGSNWQPVQAGGGGQAQGNGQASAQNLTNDQFAQMIQASESSPQEA